MKALTTTLIACAICIAIGASHHLDSGIDGKAERASAANLEDAQRQAKSEANKQRAAYMLCKSEHGANVQTAWDTSGALMCQPKRGKARHIQQAKVQP